MNAREMKVLQTRIPLDLYRETEEIFDEFGITPSDGVRMFLNTVKRTRGIPLDLRTTAVEYPERIPNEETLAAIRNVEKGNVVETSWEELRKMMGLPNA